MINSSHPWRKPGIGVQDINLAASTRSREFSAYLDTLSRDERKLIEAAERAFISKVNATISPQQAAARDYARGFLGATEDETAFV